MTMSGISNQPHFGAGRWGRKAAVAALVLSPLLAACGGKADTSAQMQDRPASAAASVDNTPQDPKTCEGTLKVELSQSHYSLDPGDWIKDSANAKEFTMPVGCDFYDRVQPGDQLLSDQSRPGSFWVRGSIGDWSLKALEKLGKHSQGAPASPADAAQPPCEGKVGVELSQSHFSLDPFEHLKDSMNATQFTMPLSCPAYDALQPGDQLLTDRFRWGSVWSEGSVGDWNLQVTDKQGKSS